MQLRHTLISFFGVLFLTAEILASELNATAADDQNQSIKPQVQEIKTPTGIWEKTKYFFEGIFEDAEEFGVDNKLISEHQ